MEISQDEEIILLEEQAHMIRDRIYSLEMELIHLRHELIVEFSKINKAKKILRMKRKGK